MSSVDVVIDEEEKKAPKPVKEGVSHRTESTESRGDRNEKVNVEHSGFSFRAIEEGSKENGM